VPLLAFTLFNGVQIREARRWVELPIIGLSFQPSDIAKLALMLYVARTMSLMHQGAIKSIWIVFLPILVVCGLIAPSDLSTALIIFLTSLIVMFIGSVNKSNMWYLFLLGVGIFSALILMADAFPDLIRLDTWTSRIEQFISGENTSNPTQIEQAKIAIAKGGFFGVGPGNGAQADNIAHAYSDFIFVIIIEEYGLFGALIVMGLYLGLLMRCVRMVTRNPKRFGSLLALGLCIMLVLQAFAHMAVNVNLLPVTGLTLPLISLGGTSLILTCVSLGIILSVSRYLEADYEGR